MAEEVLEGEAVEEGEGDLPSATASPVLAEQSGGQLAQIGGEAKAVAIAAASGIVAGAATVAVVKAAARAPAKRSRTRLLGRRDKRQDVVASRSFLVDVHLLGGR